MPPTMDTVQMNIRIDRTLKREGDAALAAAGFTPSQAVRAIWKIAVNLRDKPRNLADLLEGSTSKEPQEDCQTQPLEEAQDEKLQSFREGQRVISNMIAELGIPTQSDPSEPSLEELREQLAMERLHGKENR